MGDRLLKTRTIGKALIVAYSGITESGKREQAEAAIGEIIAAPEAAIVLDMKGVTVFVSEHITHLIRLYRTLDEQERKIYLVNVPEHVQKVLSMVNIVGRFTILPTEGALQKLFGPGASGADVETHCSLQKSTEGRRHIISITGAFVEGKSGDRLLEEIEASLMRDATEIVIDFSQTTVIDTLSTGVLLKIQEICAARGARIRAQGANAVVAHVLEANGAAEYLGM